MKEAARRSRNSEILGVSVIPPFVVFVLSSVERRAVWLGDVKTVTAFIEARADARDLVKFQSGKVELIDSQAFAARFEAVLLKATEAAAQAAATKMNNKHKKKKGKHALGVAQRRCNRWSPLNKRMVQGRIPVRKHYCVT